MTVGSSRIDLRLIIEVVAVIAVIVSLYFVRYELRQTQSVAQNESFGQMAEMSIGLNSLITSNGNIWYRGCLDQELDSEEYSTFLRMVSAVDRVHFALWSRARGGVSGAGRAL